MNNTGRVYFGLFGDFIPEELTEFIGISPTSSKRQGERNPERNIPRCSIWEYSSETIDAEMVDIYELSDWVIQRMVPKKKEIKQAIEQWNLKATLEVVLHISTDEEVSTPSIGFNRPVIDFLAYVGATIDIDTYRNYE